MIGIGILTTVQIGKYSKKICSVKRTKAHFSKQSAPALGRAFGAGQITATGTGAPYFEADFSSFLSVSTFSAAFDASVVFAASFTPSGATKR